MKRFCFLVLLSVVGKSATQEVKHAPTVEQCQADQRLWLSKLEDSKGAGVTLVAFRELTGWQHEMYECRSVDPQHRNEYENVYAESNSEKVGESGRR